MAVNTKAFRVKDTTTGKFWKGNTYEATPTMDGEGKVWPSGNAATRALSSFMRRGSWSSRAQSTLRDLPPGWALEEVELVPQPVREAPLNTFSINYRLRCELEQVDIMYAYFYDTMLKKGVADKIEFIFSLKTEKSRWGRASVSKEKIMEARAQLRLLGVKTRTFREYRGMFGMMDRDQAMKARLSLDVEGVIDLAKMRREIVAGTPVSTQHVVKV